MADYSIIVDDSDDRIVYGPGTSDWFASNSTNPDAYQGTLHVALSSIATLSFHFRGGRSIAVVGSFIDDNNAGTIAVYPIFELVDSPLDVTCAPQVALKGGQFVCRADLPSDIANRTLTMSWGPLRAPGSPFQIDYIRHGSDETTAAQEAGSTMFVQSPPVGNSTIGLTLDTNWRDINSLGTDSEIRSAIQTNTAQSKATFSFHGSSIALWNCCMPPGETLSKVGTGSYSIDGGEDVPFQIDANFTQGPQCKDEKILIQQTGLDTGFHTMEVTYNGDSTRMPLTVCAFAAPPINFSGLDRVSSGSPPPSTGFTYGGSTSSSSGLASLATAGIIVAVLMTVLVGSCILFRGRLLKRRASFMRKRSGQPDIERHSPAMLGGKTSATRPAMPDFPPVAMPKDSKDMNQWHTTNQLLVYILPPTFVSIFLDSFIVNADMFSANTMMGAVVG